MAETTSDQASTTTTGDQASQNTQQQNAGAAGATGDQASQSGRSIADFERELAETRKEAAAHRVKARELEDRLKKHDDEKLSETEKLQKRAGELEAKATAAEQRTREILTRLEIERQARKLNIVDEDAAFRLLDAAAIVYDADGKPANLEKLLGDLVKAKPYLAGSGDGGSNFSAGNPARERGGTLTHEQMRKMSRTELDARWDEVQKALAQGK